MTYNWVSLAELYDDCRAFAHSLPRDIVGVVGVPRSGVLAASLVALYQHVHVADADGFARTGLLSGAGGRLKDAPPREGTVLLLDDTCRVGKSLGRAARKIRRGRRCGAYRLLRGAIYTTPEGRRKLDYWHRVVPPPRVFEWNWTAHPDLDRWMLDIDGVLCEEPPFCEVGNEAAFVAWLTTARPNWLPRRKVRGLVTNRIGRHRCRTVQWLARHGVEYGKLIMRQEETAAARRARGRHGEWKADIYKQDKRATLFVESEPRQAEIIYRDSGKQVLCAATMRMVDG